MNLHAVFHDHRLYEAQIEKLHVKLVRRPRLALLQDRGVSLATISINRRRVARLLAGTVAAGQYEFRPAQTRLVTVNRKGRLLYVFGFTDLIVHSVVASVLTQAMMPYVSSSLHSYIKGRSWLTAVRDFAAYIRAHRRCQPDVRQRGLYVLRRDIRDYTNSIPVGDGSPLFAQLRTILSLDETCDARSADYWRLIQGVVRPVIESGSGQHFTNLRGVPTGSAISTVLFNLYLLPLDDELAAVPGGFYARYCDDFLFAHPDLQVVRAVDRRLEEVLARRGLETKREKHLDLYFNGAGRRSPDWPQACGATRITFLGCAVGFESTLGLTAAKARRLLRDLRGRARRTRKRFPLQTAQPSSPEGENSAAVGPAVCAAINNALNPAMPLRHKFAAFLRRVATDRRQLQQLDQQILRLVTWVTSGHHGVRALRQIPPRKMRTEWKLISLYHTRNRRGPRPPTAPCKR